MFHSSEQLLTVLTCYVLESEDTKMKKTVSAFKEQLLFDVRAGNCLSVHLVQLADYIDKEAEIQKGTVTSAKITQLISCPAGLGPRFFDILTHNNFLPTMVNLKITNPFTESPSPSLTF